MPLRFQTRAPDASLPRLRVSFQQNDIGVTRNDVRPWNQALDPVANKAGDKDLLVQQGRQVTDRLAENRRLRSNACLCHVVLDVERLLPYRDRLASPRKQSVAKRQKDYPRCGKPYADRSEHAERAARQFLAHSGHDNIRRLPNEGHEPAKQ